MQVVQKSWQSCGLQPGHMFRVMSGSTGNPAQASACMLLVSITWEAELFLECGDFDINNHGLHSLSRSTFRALFYKISICPRNSLSYWIKHPQAVDWQMPVYSKFTGDRFALKVRLDMRTYSKSMEHTAQRTHMCRSSAANDRSNYKWPARGSGGSNNFGTDVQSGIQCK